MGRYTGPNCKLCRRESMKLFLKGDRCFTPKCAIERHNLPPGQTGGMRPMRRRMSEYAVQLREKQKVRRAYGLMERQFRRYFRLAEKTAGLTGGNLLQILESRLDNVVYRMGFATSRKQARQLVNHRHFRVNGKPVRSPSRLMELGDEITVRPASNDLDIFVIAQERASDIGRPAWVSVDVEKKSGKVTALPERDQVDVVVNEQLIVEYYSR
ncbi:MAG TPA: 30S ribosomal protein S4 [Chloroflexota bacterium]|nr:30S ribosomal protein S4 [Chloroflexota bacterium]